MSNIVAELIHEIENVTQKALRVCIDNKEFIEVDDININVEAPKEKGHGDFSTNIAMQLTKKLKLPPRQIADSIIKRMDLNGTYIEKVECAGPGFINFFLNNSYLYEGIRLIQKMKETYGRVDIGRGQKVMVEFVSANPTGPLHMGNARGGALGDLIASVFTLAGFDVTREFYVNDAGNQIEKFGISLEARYLQLLKGEDFVPFPEDGYYGEDIIDHVKEYISKFGKKLLEVSSEERRKELVEYALPINIKRIKEGLSRYGIDFDIWFSEKSLYENGELEETLKYLKEHDLTVSCDDALWIKGSALGVEKDEVIVRNNGLPTYFATDIAYHANKFLKRKFDRVINLWGADHHGHVARMKGAVKAMGIDPDKLDVVLFQLVHLYKNGEKVRMSKRTGRAISLMDLIDEVGRDAARFIFNTKASGNHLDFDLDLAVSQSNDNPVYYVQYAHARICSLLKVIETEGVKVPEISDVDLNILSRNEELDLMKALLQYPEEICISVRTLEPSRLTRYVTEVAGLFHSFYNACRLKGEDEAVLKARLVLADSTRIVIGNVLRLLKIKAPERM